MPAPEEPANPDRERMDAISGALARMVQRQDELAQRLLRVEQAVGLAATQPLTTAPESEGPTFLIPATKTWREWLKLSPLVDEWPENVFAN